MGTKMRTLIGAVSLSTVLMISEYWERVLDILPPPQAMGRSMILEPGRTFSPRPKKNAGPDPAGQFADHSEPSVCVADQQETHAAIP